MEELARSMGTKFKVCRLLLDCTLEQVGTRVGCTRQHVHYVEMGKGYPSQPVEQRLRAAVGLTPALEIELDAFIAKLRDNATVTG